ncbi:MAG: phosphotriesterase [Bryobacterales bacterium]|nr:phosphotriesterase [Bryobacterales bacterium]
MTRRQWLRMAAAQMASPVESILVHEHVLVDFAGADVAGPDRYDAEEVFRTALPKLREVRALGCVRLQECTPAFLGRAPALLRRLSEAAELDIWTNTGLYAAREHKHLPRYAFDEPAPRLARRWVNEAARGVEGVRPRFIKIGVNRHPLPEVDRKIVLAAAMTSSHTGLTIASHTGDGRAAGEQLEILASAGVAPGKFVWVHAQNEREKRYHEQIARAGGWVEFDGVGPKSAPWHRECVTHMAAQGLLGRVLISQDSGWYRVGEPGGGAYRGYTSLYTDFLPLLDPAWRQVLLWENPRAAFG